MARASLFPRFDLDETLLLAKTIWANNAGKPMRRLTIFDILNRSPTSSTSRFLVTASSSYGLTQGGYTAEVIALTERGQAIVEHDDPRARLDAVLGIEVFSSFFNHYRNSIVPSTAAAIDFLKRQGISEKGASTCLDVLLKSGEQVGLVQEISGVKRVVSSDHALEKLQEVSSSSPSQSIKTESEKQDLAAETPLSYQDTGPALAFVKSNHIPTLHVDIQIHISADSRPEQIDQIFASMAKHIYKNA